MHSGAKEPTRRSLAAVLSLQQPLCSPSYRRPFAAPCRPMQLATPMAHQMPPTRLNFSGAKRPGVLETRRAAHPDEVLDVERASQALAQQHGVLAELFGTRVSTTRSGEARWLLHCNVQLAPLALGSVDVAVCSPPRTLSGRRRSQYMSLKNLQAADPCWEQVYPHVRRGLCCGHPGCWRLVLGNCGAPPGLQPGGSAQACGAPLPCVLLAAGSIYAISVP